MQKLLDIEDGPHSDLEMDKGQGEKEGCNEQVLLTIADIKVICSFFSFLIRQIILFFLQYGVVIPNSHFSILMQIVKFVPQGHFFFIVKQENL